MMKPIHILIIFALMLLVIPVAGENLFQFNVITMKGPYDILVSLGIENFLPIAQARIYYNWISVLMLVVIGSMAASNTTRFFGLLIPVVAGLLMYFGWFTAVSTPTMLTGVVIVGALLAAAVYMKGSLHERFGIAGPGSTMFNIVFFIIILQATVGFVNSTNLWGGLDAAPTATTEYSDMGFDVREEVNSISETGGGLDNVTDVGSVLLDLTLGVIQMFISMAVALGAFSVFIAVIYPWIAANTMGAALLVLIQLGIYIVYYVAFMQYIRPVTDGAF